MRFIFLTIFIFINVQACATDFNLSPGMEDNDGTGYYILTAKNIYEQTKLDIALEGNSNAAIIRDKITYSCSWGDVDGVRVEMSSSTYDGVMTVESFYFFDKKLSNIFAHSYALMNKKTPYIPLSLNYSVCKNRGEGVKKDSRTGRDYVDNYEVIADGPFDLKGVKGVRIKYVVDNGVKLLKESSVGDFLIDKYKDEGDRSPKNASVFFTTISSKRNIISLMLWDKDIENNKPACYKVYAYTYDDNGNISKNLAINNDKNLSGCEYKGNEFSYKNSASIKDYLIKKFKG